MRLCTIGLARDVLDDAETLLEGVLVLAPDYEAARFNYAQVLTRRHKYAQAGEQLERLMKAEPANREYRSLAATVAVGLGQHQRAISLYRELLRESPRSADVHLWLGHALKTTGHFAEAIAAYQAAASIRSDFGAALAARRQDSRQTVLECEQDKPSVAAAHHLALGRQHCQSVCIRPAHQPRRQGQGVVCP